MKPRNMSAREVDDGIARIDAIGRSRALTCTESAELENLLYRRDLRRRRLQAQIERTRAKLHGLLEQAA